jgi:predicted metalloprotease
MKIYKFSTKIFRSLLRSRKITLFVVWTIGLAYLIASKQSVAEPSAEQLMQYYGLHKEKKVSLEMARGVFPPHPVSLMEGLPSPTNPLLQKPIKEMSDDEIDQIVKTTANKINEYWRGVFSTYGAIHAPTSVRTTNSKSRYVMDGVYFSPTKNGNGTIHIARDSLRRISRDSTMGIMISAIIAHEIAHAVAFQLGLDNFSENKNHTSTITRIRALAPNLNKYPLIVYIEMQANFLAGVSLKYAGFLHQGGPEEIYYGTVLSGDDMASLIADFARPKNYPEHGLGKDQAAIIYEGMQTGNVEKGLQFLGAEPDWNRLRKGRSISADPRR